MLRLQALAEYARSSLWVLPSLAVLAALVLGTALAAVPDADLVAPLVPPVGPDGARALLQTVAGSVITVTSLVFSLTVLALQLAASNYSPRLLRNFLRDVGNQVVLAIFLATFAYSYAVLRTVRAEGDGQEAFVPSLAVDVLLLFVLASLAAFVYFIHHLTQSIRIERILDSVLDETMETIARTWSDADPEATLAEREPPPDIPPGAVAVPAGRSGTVQAYALERLVEQASVAQAVVRFRPAVGEHVVAGTTLGWVWPRADLGAALEDAVQVGRERTTQQDVAYGLRQLVDIALRAISPGINDPTTAMQAVDRMSVILAALAVRPLPNTLCHDGAATLRVAVPAPDFGDYLDLACTQLRHYGFEDRVLVGRIVRMLADIRSLSVSERRQREIDVQMTAFQEGQK